MHGIGMPLIGIAAALLLANEKVSGLPLKTALKSVEWNLLLFLAGTLVIGEALLETGTAKVLAERMVGLAGSSIAAWPVLIVALAAIAATLSHLVITSRTARATVLIPALALPLAALGVDPLNLVMVVTLASGFCQTLMVSAKPVALFGAMDPPPFGQGRLVPACRFSDRALRGAAHRLCHIHLAAAGPAAALNGSDTRNEGRLVRPFLFSRLIYFQPAGIDFKPSRSSPVTSLSR